MKQNWKQMVGTAILVNLLALALAATIWKLPDLRPIWIPDVQTLALFTITATNTFVLLGYLLWSGVPSLVIKTAVVAAIAAGTFVIEQVRTANAPFYAMLVLFFGGAFFLSEIGVAPPHTEWIYLAEDTRSFFMRYLALLVVTVLLGLALIVVARQVKGSTLRYLPEASKHYPVGLALAICLVPPATLVAQIFSGAVSWEGIALLWDPKLGDVTYVDLSWSWADFFGGADTNDAPQFSVTLSGAEVWATVFAIVISSGVWLAALFLTLQVIHGLKPSKAAVIVVVFFASGSILTASIHHYFSEAQTEYLRSGIAETDARLKHLRAEDTRILLGLEGDAASQQDRYQNRRQAGIAEALNNEFKPIVAGFNDGLSTFGDLGSLISVFRSAHDSFEQRYEDEFERGLYTGAPGSGKVATNLLTLATAYDKATVALEEIEARRFDLLLQLDQHKIAYHAAMSDYDFENARIELDRLRNAAGSSHGLDPSGAVAELLSTISLPLLSGEESSSLRLAENQREAIAAIQDELSKSVQRIRGRLDRWENRTVDLLNTDPVARILPSDIRPDLAQEIRALAELRGLLLDIFGQRDAAFDGIAQELQRIGDNTTALLVSEHPITDSAKFVDEINFVRRSLQQNTDLDLMPVSLRIGSLMQSGDHLARRLSELQPEDLPRLAAFEDVPPLWVISRYWRVGAIYLILQVILDLGFTLGLVWIVTNLRASRDEHPDIAPSNAAAERVVRNPFRSNGLSRTVPSGA